MQRITDYIDNVDLEQPQKVIEFIDFVDDFDLQEQVEDLVASSSLTKENKQGLTRHRSLTNLCSYIATREIPKQLSFKSTTATLTRLRSCRSAKDNNSDRSRQLSCHLPKPKLPKLNSSSSTKEESNALRRPLEFKSTTLTLQNFRNSNSTEDNSNGIVRQQCLKFPTPSIQRLNRTKSTKVNNKSLSRQVTEFFDFVDILDLREEIDNFKKENKQKIKRQRSLPNLDISSATKENNKLLQTTLPRLSSSTSKENNKGVFSTQTRIESPAPALPGSNNSFPTQENRSDTPRQQCLKLPTPTLPRFNRTKSTTDNNIYISRQVTDFVDFVDILDLREEKDNFKKENKQKIKRHRSLPILDISSATKENNKLLQPNLQRLSSSISKKNNSGIFSRQLVIKSPTPAFPGLNNSDTTKDNKCATPRILGFGLPTSTEPSSQKEIDSCKSRQVTELIDFVDILDLGEEAVNFKKGKKETKTRQQNVPSPYFTKEDNGLLIPTFRSLKSFTSTGKSNNVLSREHNFRFPAASLPTVSNSTTLSNICNCTTSRVTTKLLNHQSRKHSFNFSPYLLALPITTHTSMNCLKNLSSHIQEIKMYTSIFGNENNDLGKTNQDILHVQPQVYNTDSTNDDAIVRLDNKTPSKFWAFLSDIISQFDDADNHKDYVTDEERDSQSKHTPVTIAVEAAALCEPYVSNQRDHDSERESITLSNFVGVVVECDHSAIDYGIKPGRRVASIRPWGVHSQFVTIAPKHLLPVPVHLDAADIATVFAFYLPAFQALHHGQDASYRYATSSLEGKRVLVVGSSNLLLNAIIRMAKYAGSTEIYVIAPKELFALIRQSNVATFDDKPSQWAKLQKCMDFVVDCSFPRNLQVIRSSLASGGRLVCYPAWGSNVLNPTTEASYLLQLSTMKRASLYDLKQSAKTHREQFWDDAVFLLRLLELRRIRPRIDEVLNKLDQKEIAMEQNRGGAIVWEPENS